MLKRTLLFTFGMVCGACLMYGSLKYHVIRSKESWHVIEKTDASLRGIYVDIRGFEFDDWKQHPELMAAIVRSQKANLLAEIKNGIFRETGRQFLGDLIN